MATRTCQHCGTGLSSPRAKNCTACSAVKAEAQQLGVYGSVVSALGKAQRDGLTGPAVAEFARTAMQAEVDRQNNAARRQREQEREFDAKREARKAEREAQNAILRQHGYRWIKNVEDEEEADAFAGWPSMTIGGWTLYAPDGVEVSVQQALDEIKRGRDVVRSEIVEREQAEARARELKNQIKERVGQIADYIRASGERPDGWNHTEGEWVLDSGNIYGTGSWFVINIDYIWYVRNNGMDGDDWGLNNVITGGAGGIGYRITFRQDIADELIRLQHGELSDRFYLPHVEVKSRGVVADFFGD